MKTKAEIIQKLLDKKHIKVEDAMILMEKEKEYVYLNYPYYQQPYWSVMPYVSSPNTELSGTYSVSGKASACSIMALN